MSSLLVSAVLISNLFWFYFLHIFSDQIVHVLYGLTIKLNKILITFTQNWQTRDALRKQTANPAPKYYYVKLLILNIMRVCIICA